MKRGVIHISQYILFFFNVAYHCYGDNIQLYLSLRCNNDYNIASLFEWLDEIMALIVSSFLQLNESKSEVV